MTKPPSHRPVDGTDELRLLDSALERVVEAGEVPIPPYPAVALKVQQLLSRKDFGLADLSRLISSDGTLAADVLRCANSAVYARGSPVTTLAQAVTRVGSQQVLRLLLASSLAGHAQEAGTLALLRRQVWIESLASAAVCQELARLRGLKSEEAFVVGLLHDFGKVVACAGLELSFAKAKNKALGHLGWPLPAVAQAVERQHVHLGNLIASRWKLPPLVQHAIGNHHGTPTEGVQEPLLEAVRAADAVVELLMMKSRVSPADLVPVRTLTSLSEREAVSRVLEQVPELVAAFEQVSVANTTYASAIALPDTTLSRQARAVDFAVEVRVGGRTQRYTATTIETNGIALSGEQPMPECHLVTATLHGGPEPFRIWAYARLSRSDGALYRVELKPFALKGTEPIFWTHLLDEAGPALA
ncbi:MAG TPA: HDOD domain-containing protein [Anaeromyxobacteraceae bacterium]|nr:HDOD domain-containing protein [Anaeromyxobacteraceae bacterium]